jgi:hypothetical protein
MSEELKPCPFCGGQPKPVHLNTNGEWVVWHACKTNLLTCWTFRTKSDAITAWNARHDDKGLIKALEEICGTTCVDGYGKVIEIADAALGKYKGV